jgi:CRISPR-associated endoribonuclease Cas6
MNMEQPVFPEAFTYLTIGFKIQLQADAVFPKFKGSMFRGVLGKAMHDLSCQKKDAACNICDAVLNCPYANLFKPELILENQLVTVPFVVFSPDNRECLDPDDIIIFQVTLLGDFSDYIDYFLKSLHFARQIGLGHKRATFEILEISANGNTIFKNGKIKDRRGLSKQSLADIRVRKTPVKKIKLRFLSPVSIYREKKHIYSPRLEDIIEYIVHRVNRLNKSIWRVEEYSLNREWFNGSKINVSKYRIDYNKIFKSKGLGNKVELSGFTGYMEFTGCPDRLYPLLRAGEILHIGSRTSYGLGKFEVID